MNLMHLLHLRRQRDEPAMDLERPQGRGAATTPALDRGETGTEAETVSETVPGHGTPAARPDGPVPAAPAEAVSAEVPALPDGGPSVAKQGPADAAIVTGPGQGSEPAASPTTSGANLDGTRPHISLEVDPAALAQQPQAADRSLETGAASGFEPPETDPPGAQPVEEDRAEHQPNVAVSDDDAVATAHALTYINEITDSVVYIAGNVATATAVNVAPTEQINAAAGGGATQQSNVAFTDNDADAVAVALTHVNTARDSVLIFGGNSANAEALNVAPVIQSNVATDLVSFDVLGQLLGGWGGESPGDLGIAALQLFAGKAQAPVAATEPRVADLAHVMQLDEVAAPSDDVLAT